MSRLAVLDGMRGYFLVFMLLNHLSFTGGLWLVHVNHAELGFVQDAQGFIFLSGLLVGLLYGRRVARGDAAAMKRKLLRRTVELQAYALIVLLLVLAAHLTLDFSWEFWGPWLGRPELAPQAHLGLAALLLYQPIFMDILPQYILYLLVSPWLILLVARGRWLDVVAGSVVLWLLVQLGLHMPMAARLDHVLQALVPGFALRTAFNVLAWQIVFVSGLVAGTLGATGQLDWRSVLRPDRAGLAKACLAILVALAVWRLGLTFELWGREAMDRFWARERREEFSLVFLLNFAALAYLVAWLLVAGPGSSSSICRASAAGLQRLFTLPALMLLGRHSLQVYAYHVLLAYALVAADWHLGPFSSATKTLIAVAAIASLALPALVHEALRRAGAPSPRPARG